MHSNGSHDLRVERRRFFANDVNDVAKGDRNEQLARLSNGITVDAAPPPGAVVWLDLIDAHKPTSSGILTTPRLKHSCLCGSPQRLLVHLSRPGS